MDGMLQNYRIRAKEDVLVFDLNLLKAMSDETRSNIIRFLCTQDNGEMAAYSVTELATQFNLTPSTVSHHLQLLRRAGLVTVERCGKERHYSLDFNSLRRRVGQFYDLLTSIHKSTLSSSTPALG